MVDIGTLGSVQALEYETPDEGGANRKQSFGMCFDV